MNKEKEIEIVRNKLKESRVILDSYIHDNYSKDIFDWFRAVEFEDKNSNYCKEKECENKLLANDLKISEIYSAYLEILHKFYYLRDSSNGFLGKYEK